MLDERERPFIRAILADPEAAEPRLVYADWLEERGDVRAEAVRVGVQRKLRQWERMDDMQVDLSLEQLDRRQKNLNLDYSRKCREQLPQIPGVEWGRFEGGVVEAVTIKDENAFRQHAGEILDVQPVHQLQYYGGLKDEALPAMLGSPELARLGRLAMGANYDGPGVARVLADSPHLANLRSLILGYTSIGVEGAAHLARAKHLAGLRDLVLTRNELTEDGLRTLCAAPQFAQLERLMLGNNDLGAGAAAMLAQSPLANLRWLELSSNELGAHGVMALLDAAWLGQIEWLDLGWCGLKPHAVEAFFAAGACPRLQRLNLVGNPIGGKVCAALAKNPWPALRELRLEITGKIGTKIAAAFAGAAWWPHLEKFTLRGDAWPSLGPALAEVRFDRLVQLHVHNSNKPTVDRTVGDATVAQLAGNASLQNLRLLELHAPMTPAALEHLAKMTQLQRLIVRGPRDADPAPLKAALPRCKVEFTHYRTES